MSRLANAPSAYLRSAAHQPVDWHPWSPEAFARAATEGKPILLDIGAVWCHWCHVMDRESYEDATLADLLNDQWICVKVDRDERPDVDARYQRAVQAISGQGGWPLTGFLTPEGEVFFGGTYFPPDGAHDRPGFRTVLTELARLWREERPRLVEQAGILRTRLADAEGETVNAGAVTPEILAGAADGLARVFDFRYGGFGSQPKFPHPGALRFLLHRGRDGGQDWPRDLVDRTLTAMAKGGIYDQVGGGFHRYSVDARWIVPHFEKMLYDNAELLSAYCDALASGPDAPLYRDIIQGIARWTLDVLADAAGGYSASQDADINLDDDGDYFTWTLDEVRAACLGDLADAMIRHYGVAAQGDMHHDPSRNVLHVVEAIQTNQRDAGRAALLEARARRQAPYVDRTVYVGWSALMASALLKAAAVLGREDLTAHALTTLERLFTEGLDTDGGLRHAVNGPGGLLEDQAYGTQAALDAFEHTGNAAWRDRAVHLADHVLRHYATSSGLLRDRAAQAGEGLLGEPAYPIHDAPAPSPNGVMADVCARLTAHTGDDRFVRAARRVLEAVGETLGDLGVHGASLLLAADRLLNPATYVVVVAGNDDAGRGLRQTARAGWAPRRVLTLRAPDDDPAGLPDPVRAMLTGAHPRAYVCVGTACRAPAGTPLELHEALSA